MDILLLVGGLLLILLGANGLTDGAASIAKRFNIPSIVIGLTIVAFGTSAPELTVSVSSALKGSPDIAIGNVVGSNIFNSLMIVGCTALIAPIPIVRNTLRKEIPLSILAAVALFFCVSDVWMDGSTAGNVVSHTDGWLLLCFFAIFLGYTFAIAKPEDVGTSTSESEGGDIKVLPWWQSILYIVGGLAGLVYGGRLFVDGATGLALGLGVSESVVGLTIVAGGTSLPELATSVVAAWKKNPEIAIGNVVGSNLFNIFFILGTSAAITPLPLQGITLMDFYVLIGSGVLLWLFGLFFAKRTITRPEGIILFLAYVAYTTVLILQQS
ncbi:MAG: calcium/sodium antiporter [Bacteroides sp.]|nr:calcium/sodium antiporter [Bacteroides sp.]